MIRVVLPFHLRNLARVDGEVMLAIDGPVTMGAVLETLENKYPVLRGTIRDHGTLKRRPFIRFSPAKKTGRTNLRRPACLPRWSAVPNRF